MLNNEEHQKIEEMEKMGMNVVSIGNDGTLDYSTKGFGNTSDYCDQCEYLRLLPDPNPYDWFRDGDKKAVCMNLKAKIYGGLERPSEWINIIKPLYCPKLGRELTAKEQQIAKMRLETAREDFKNNN